MIARIDLAPGLGVSRLAYGMWRLTEDADISPRHVQAKIEACLAQGITTIDQADIYGGYTAEGVFGACLKAAPHLRNQIEIITKCDIIAPVGRHAGARVKYYDTSAKHINASVEASLRAMNIEQIDILLIHRQDPFMDADETGGALDALVASGKIRAAGVSNFRPWDFELLQSAMTERLVTNQIEISITCNDPFMSGDIAFLQRRQIAPMAWSPLGGGALVTGGDTPLASVLARMAAEHGVDTAAIAIAFLLAHPARIIPVMGTNRLDRIAHLSDAFGVDLGRQDWFEIYQAALGREVP